MELPARPRPPAPVLFIRLATPKIPQRWERYLAPYATPTRARGCRGLIDLIAGILIVPVAGREVERLRTTMTGAQACARADSHWRGRPPAVRAAPRRRRHRLRVAALIRATVGLDTKGRPAFPATRAGGLDERGRLFTCRRRGRERLGDGSRGSTSRAIAARCTWTELAERTSG